LHDLIPLGPALPGALTTAEIDATMAYAEAEKALATRAAYASDFDTRPPRPTARNTGPALISAAASHVCTASTGRSL
jgi:hypothetical protein